jgi:hypothetical protein
MRYDLMKELPPTLIRIMTAATCEAFSKVKTLHLCETHLEDSNKDWVHIMVANRERARKKCPPLLLLLAAAYEINPQFRMETDIPSPGTTVMRDGQQVPALRDRET